MSSAPESQVIADRYGRGTGRVRSRRLAVVLIAVGLVLAFVVWLLWRSSIGADSMIDGQIATFDAVDETAIDVTAVIDLDPAATASCAIEIQGKSKSIVGWLVVDVPTSDRRARVLEERVMTTELGVVGLISRCWLT